MSSENPTEFSVNGLVIFDLNDLPEVTAENDKFICGDTVIPRTGATFAFEELRARSQELYAIALKVRELETSPQLALAITVIQNQTNHSEEEARKIALAMIANGVFLYA